MSVRNPTAAAHIDWLRVLAIDGPFLSLPVLLRAMPNGPEPLPPGSRAALREQLQLVEDAESTPAEFARYLLHEFLAFPTEAVAWGASPQLSPLKTIIETHRVELRPTAAIFDNGKPTLLVLVVNRADQKLTAVDREEAWPISPIERLRTLCRATGVRCGLVTNGVDIAIVDVPGLQSTDPVSGAGLWDNDTLHGEPSALAALRDLIGQRRTLTLERKDTLPELLAESREAGQALTDQLGLQVRRAVEIFVRALDRANADQHDQLLRDVPPREIYHASVTVAMRIIFLLCAEERGLLHLRESLYDDNYAVGTLHDQLRADADRRGEQVLERNHDAWARLLALFRAIHAGVKHHEMPIRPYGGRLFDPDRYPFLEGRQAGTKWTADGAGITPPIHNRTVLHFLESVQYLRTTIAGQTEVRRLSFAQLDIEQIGHVYEGLLDHSVERADSAVLGLVGTSEGDEPEVRLETLEAWSKSAKKRATELKKLGVASTPKALEKLLTKPLPPERLARLRNACADEALWKRIEPFAGLIRDDDLGDPLIFPKNCYFFTQGIERRASGSHYTPRALTEPIAERTLEPACYTGPQQGKPKTEWVLRSAQELLDLKVLDPAVGSGAFLVAAIRYVGARLLEAWDAAGAGKSALTIFGTPSTGAAGETLVPNDLEERKLLALRLVATRCVYGVDKNPIAAEMAKLSIWLLTMSAKSPFTFLDHAIKAGDSILGFTRQEISQFDWDPLAAPTFTKLRGDIAFPTAVRLRREVVEQSDLLAPAELDGRMRSAEQAIDDLRIMGDLLAYAFFMGDNDRQRRAILERLRPYIDRWLADTSLKEGFRALAARVRIDGKDDPLRHLREPPSDRHGQTPFHWELEFPEVFLRDNPGFDAIIGNPPFAGKNTLQIWCGDIFPDYLKLRHPWSHGNADFCAHFFCRAATLLRTNGVFGLIATNTIAQGDTRSTGLRRLRETGVRLFHVTKRRKWPGKAAVVVSVIHGVKGDWNGEISLDGKPAPCISAFLFPDDRDRDPKRLTENAGKSFQGSIVLGMGFTFDDQTKKPAANRISEMQALIKKNPRNQERIFAYLGGKELNTHPTHAHHRYVIDFGDMSEADAQSKYPDLMKIVREKVKPERDVVRDDGARTKWWQFIRGRPELYAAIAGKSSVLGLSRVSSILLVASLPTDIVYADSVVVLTDASAPALACVQSRVHEVWALFLASTLEDRLRYTPSDCFETFPFPVDYARNSALEVAGKAYLDHRTKVMTDTMGAGPKKWRGLTKTYNDFHDPACKRREVQLLRDLHHAMDVAVLRAYGWDDIADTAAPEFIEIHPGDPKTKQRLRWPDGFRDEVLSRLLALNDSRAGVAGPLGGGGEETLGDEEDDEEDSEDNDE